MSDGPNRAPSSPPETPEPMKRNPRALTAASRRTVSVQSKLPPSMTMSPLSRRGRRPSITASVPLPRLDEDDDLPQAFSRGHKFFERRKSGKPARSVRVCEDDCLVLLVVRSWPNAEAMVRDVESEVLAHDGQTD